MGWNQSGFVNLAILGMPKWGGIKMANSCVWRPYIALETLEGTIALRTRHPNECSGNLSQCFTPKHHSLLWPRKP